MTERRKARVGDTIRLNGKNPARQSGERVVNRVVDARHTHPDGSMSTYWVGLNHDPDDPGGSAWELQFDIVEPEPEFNKGDKVKLTPKDGGETVIYGEYRERTLNHHKIWVTGEYTNAFQIYEWNIELVKPTTEEILNGLGENAFVAHRTDADYYGYYKRGGQWYDAGDSDEIGHGLQGLFTVAYWMEDDRGERKFEIIFEGIKDE